MPYHTSYFRLLKQPDNEKTTTKAAGRKKKYLFSVSFAERLRDAFRIEFLLSI